MKANSPRYIPENFDGTFTFYGFSFRWANFIEGCVFGAIGAVLMYFFAYEFLVIDNTSYLIAAAGLGAFLGLMFGIRGINGDHVIVFVIHTIKQFLRRRIMKYNPRVKYEAIYLDSYTQAQQEQMMNSKEFQSVLDRFMSRIKGNPQQIQDAETNRNENQGNVQYIFKDDIGVVKNTPEQLKPRKSIIRRGGVKNAGKARKNI